MGEPAELGPRGIAEALDDAETIVDAVRIDVSVVRALRAKICLRTPVYLTPAEEEQMFETAILQLAQLVLLSKPCPTCGVAGTCMHR